MGKRLVAGILLVVSMLLMSVVVRAGQRAEFTEVAPIQAVTISYTAWTAIPSSPDYSRVAVMFDMASSSTDTFRVMMSTVPPSGTVGTATAGVGFTYYPSDPPWVLPISKNVYLYGICNGKDSETLYIQELRGR